MKGEKGTKCGFEGRMIDGGKRIKGFWYDYDKGVTPGNRFVCTCVIELEGHNVLKGKYKTKEGGVEEWEAKRWSEQDVPRQDGKIKSFCMKNAAHFSSLTDNGKEKRAANLEAARKLAMEESVSRPFLDGAITYIPGPASGSEYMTAHGSYKSTQVFFSQGLSSYGSIYVFVGWGGYLCTLIPCLFPRPFFTHNPHPPVLRCRPRTGSSRQGCLPQRRSNSLPSGGCGKA